MFRVGIIGSENSHALAFTKIFNLSGAYEDIRVVGVWGEDPEASEKIKADFGLDIDKRDITVSETIKLAGEYVVKLKLFAGISTELKLVVES